MNLLAGRTKNICWSNNSGFNSTKAGKFVKEYNESLKERIDAEH